MPATFDTYLVRPLLQGGTGQIQTAVRGAGDAYALKLAYHDDALDRRSLGGRAGLSHHFCGLGAGFKNDGDIGVGVPPDCEHRVVRSRRLHRIAAGGRRAHDGPSPRAGPPRGRAGNSPDHGDCIRRCGGNRC